MADGHKQMANDHEQHNSMPEEVNTEAHLETSPKQMNFPARLVNKLVFSDEPGELLTRHQPSRYRRMWRNTVFAVAAVSIVPLVVVSAVNYYLYSKSFNEEITQPIHRITAISKRAIESFLDERVSAAKYVISRESINDLYDSKMLSNVFRRMRNSFGGIVDIGIVDSKGVMRTYIGPYDLQGKDYKSQDWFHKMLVSDVYVSDVFMGHRQLPHFIIAVKRETEQGDIAIFRATIDTEVLNRQIQISGLHRDSDAFIINTGGELQTPSRLFGSLLATFPHEVPPYVEGIEIDKDVRIDNASYIMGYAFIKNSPFVFLTLSNKEQLMTGWLAYQGEIFFLIVFSMLAIFVLIMGITSNWVTRIKISDIRREATLHSNEHTNKMASIGRLAAGVAHEINNPLAIINEKAGLLQDIIGTLDDFPKKEKFQKLVHSILNSVERCSVITHRLLGFARHMDVRIEPIAVDAMIREVLAFLEKEAQYRKIEIHVDVSDTLPTIHSDKGQLQQLFLNIINNSLDAMKAGGHLHIKIVEVLTGYIEVSVTDDGQGIEKANLNRIFEPFYTTKKSKGTGLGLSICYGIVKKLRGEMKVESEIGVGTTFTISLPIHRSLTQPEE